MSQAECNGAIEECNGAISETECEDDAESGDLVVGDVCIQFLSGEQWTIDLPIFCDIGRLTIKLARQLGIHWSQIKMTKEVAEGVFEDCQHTDHIMKDRLQGVKLYHVVVNSLRKRKVIENAGWRDLYDRFMVVDENGERTRDLTGSELEIPKAYYREAEEFLLNEEGEPVKVVYV